MLRTVACSAPCCARTLSSATNQRSANTFALSGLASARQAARSAAHRSTASNAARGMAAAAAAGQEPAAVAAVAAAAEAPATGNGGAAPIDTLLQYVVLRRDLWTELEWPLGSVVAQGCHAATAALWESRQSAATQEYCAPENIDHMHKVVLEIKSEAQLRNLAAKLAEAGVPHKLWIEQPEDYATCLATAPCPKSQAAPHLKKLKLCKGA